MLYEDALAVFQALGRLVDSDHTGAVIVTDGEEKVYTVGQVTAGASALLRSDPNLAQAMVHNDFFDPDDILEPEDSTPGGEEEYQPIQHERSQPMFHMCPTHNRRLFASSDGMCKACRPVTVAEELHAPSFQTLLEDIGGDGAFAASISAIAEARRAGRRGDSVGGRLTRAMLDLIAEQPPAAQPALLMEYREYLGQFGVGLTSQEERDDRGETHVVHYHDYSNFRRVNRGVQPAIPHMAPVLNQVVTGEALRERMWQANVAERRSQRQAHMAQVRATRAILMRWVSREDENDAGSKVIGPNTDETRTQAAEWQAAGIRAGYKVEFELVNGS